VPRAYSLAEVVDIAVESVRATTSGFDPKLSLTSEATFAFSELALPLVCDVFYIAFGNVAAHAGTNRSTGVWVTVDRDEDDKHLIIAIENEVTFKSDLEYETLKRKLESIRVEIRESHGAARARSEGGSGLFKLACVVAQVEGDTLEFGCTRERFRLRFKISYSPDRPF
jgi:hypothetical protein